MPARAAPQAGMPSAACALHGILPSRVRPYVRAPTRESPPALSPRSQCSPCLARYLASAILAATACRAARCSWAAHSSLSAAGGPATPPAGKGGGRRAVRPRLRQLLRDVGSRGALPRPPLYCEHVLCSLLPQVPPIDSCFMSMHAREHAATPPQLVRISIDIPGIVRMQAPLATAAHSVRVPSVPALALGKPRLQLALLVLPMDHARTSCFP